MQKGLGGGYFLTHTVHPHDSQSIRYINVWALMLLVLVRAHAWLIVTFIIVITILIITKLIFFSPNGVVQTGFNNMLAFCGSTVFCNVLFYSFFKSVYLCLTVPEHVCVCLCLCGCPSCKQRFITVSRKKKTKMLFL